MAPRRYLPDVDEIIRMMERGMSQGEIGELYGVGPAAVSAAVARAGKARDRRKYPEMIPWRVRQIHNNQYDLTMLRLEGRRRAGEPIAKYRLQKLAAWRANLAEQDAVIYYDPDTPQGFFRIRRSEAEDRGLTYMDPNEDAGRRRRRSGATRK